MDKKRILLVLTGGTICSFTNELGEQASDTDRARALIVKNFRKSSSPYASELCVDFTEVSPLDTLSENMTVAHWNTLLHALAGYNIEGYDGVILLHGTDTLAYTASMLALTLAGISVPVILVSSQLALDKEGTNGNANFKAAVELIANGISPNVYAVYRNGSEGDPLFVHYAAHLLQCGSHSNNFYSCDMTEISSENAIFKGSASPSVIPLLYSPEFNGLHARVLKIEVYVGLDYGAFNLDGVDAIVHGTYHSSTVATSPILPNNDLSRNSILTLKRECDKKEPPIPIFIEPYESTVYETTGKALRNGIYPIENLTSEMAYVKTLVGCSLGLRGDELYEYIKTDVNGESTYFSFEKEK